ncbi:hypothetical protein M422DRAFT_35195 [Sphaerobolus stellatus SS14]|uniref:Uncharacterized protein n=1 Tax=Sphaerobolus stellatus (strain SS14) TaxID=990650 RepID=A0A0C9UHB1_SPHS4|nr:hypothetical protein M422DRAFT_35195 [Sphaerobolus stellatus SS14]
MDSPTSRQQRPASSYASSTTAYYCTHDHIPSSSNLRLKIDHEFHCSPRAESPRHPQMMPALHDVDVPRTPPHLEAPTSIGWQTRVSSHVYPTPDDIPSTPRTSHSTLNSPTSAMSTPAVATPTSPSWWHTAAAPLPTDRKTKRSSTFSLSRLANTKPNRWVRRLKRANSNARCPSATGSEDEEDDMAVEEERSNAELVTSFGAYRLRLD